MSQELGWILALSLSFLVGCTESPPAPKSKYPLTEVGFLEAKRCDEACKERYGPLSGGYPYAYVDVATGDCSCLFYDSNQSGRGRITRAELDENERIKILVKRALEEAKEKK